MTKVGFWRAEILMRSIATSAMILVVAHSIRQGDRLVADLTAATACIMAVTFVRALLMYREARGAPPLFRRRP